MANQVKRFTARPKRELETREAVYSYRPAATLDIPEQVADIFDKAGFQLRWIRFLVNGQEDVQNVTKRMREGYTFVNRSDIPEEFQHWFEVAKIRNVNQAICVGDLALAKIEHYKAHARQMHTQGKSQEAVKAARREAHTTKDGRMETMTPIVVDDAETEVEIS